MARKSTPAPAATETPPAMDYAQHQATWNAVVSLVKWSIAGILVVLVALYCFIEGNQPILGTILLLVIPAGAVALAVTRWRSPA